MAPHFGHITGQVDGATYGVSHNFDDDGHFDYLAGIAVTSFTGVPDDLVRLRIAAHRYAVFLHTAHVSALPATHNTIWNVWLPQSGLELAEPLNFERYERRFDPKTGMGGVEIWIPVKS